jgi:hypothetical protein
MLLNELQRQQTENAEFQARLEASERFVCSAEAGVPKSASR